MNIFYLSDDVNTCAQWHIDRHVIKMMIEYSQLLSTAHRALDGKEVTIQRDHIGKRPKKLLLLDGETIQLDTINTPSETGFTIVGQKCCLNTHLTHPSAKWVRLNDKNYLWLFELLVALQNEWRYRYGHNRQHKLERLYQEFLANPPKNIPKAEEKTKMFIAMDSRFKISDDPITCYQYYYIMDKVRFANWKNRNVPDWFNPKT